MESYERKDQTRVDRLALAVKTWAQLCWDAISAAAITTKEYFMNGW